MSKYWNLAPSCIQSKRGSKLVEGRLLPPPVLAGIGST
jgi:hypothetical protein